MNDGNAADSVQTWARIAGVLLVLTMVCGAFGEMYVPSKIVVAADASATAANLEASETLFRLGFAAYLIEAVCDIALALLFYLILRPVRQDLALAAAFFGLVSTATFATGQLVYFASSLILRDAEYLRTFSIDQRNTLVLLAIKTYGLCSGVFLVFYGIATLLRGLLIFRSGFLPKFIGVLLSLGGIGFIAKSFTHVLAPSYSSNLFLVPMFLGALSLMVWLLVKGVEVGQWRERQRVS